MSECHNQFKKQVLENLTESRSALERLQQKPEYQYASKRINQAMKRLEHLQFDQNFYEQQMKEKSIIQEYDVIKSEQFLQEVAGVETLYRKYLRENESEGIQQDIQTEKKNSRRMPYYDAYHLAYDIKEKATNQGKNELYEFVNGGLVGREGKGHLFLNLEKRYATFTHVEGGTHFIPYQEGFKATLYFLKDKIVPKKVEYNPHTVSGQYTTCAICNRPLKNPLAQHIGVGSSCLKKMNERNG